MHTGTHVLRSFMQDGRTYWHCDMCQKCVKPGNGLLIQLLMLYVLFSCCMFAACSFVQDVCTVKSVASVSCLLTCVEQREWPLIAASPKRDSRLLDEAFPVPLSPSMGCHVCGSLQHKRRDCPKRATVSEKSKRVAAGRAGTSRMARWAAQWLGGQQNG